MRKPKHITLARFQRWDGATGSVLTDRDAEQQAEAATPKHGTPERLAKAPIVSMGADRVQRVTDAPLDVLWGKGSFDKRDGSHETDTAYGKCLYEAGKRFREHWFKAGLNGISAMDMGRVGTGEGHPAWSIATSEFAAQHRSEIRSAYRHLGPYLGKFVVAIVAEEMIPEDAGRTFSGRIDKATSRAVAIEVLRAGLASLAAYWGMVR